jgi:hypothetical protein
MARSMTLHQVPIQTAWSTSLTLLETEQNAEIVAAQVVACERATPRPEVGLFSVKLTPNALFAILDRRRLSDWHWER